MFHTVALSPRNYSSFPQNTSTGGLEYTSQSILLLPPLTAISISTSLIGRQGRQYYCPARIFIVIVQAKAYLANAIAGPHPWLGVK